MRAPTRQELAEPLTDAAIARCDQHIERQKKLIRERRPDKGYSPRSEMTRMGFYEQRAIPASCVGL